MRNIPTDFMESDLVRQAVLNLITQIECARETQNEIDSIYQNLCDCILSEMSSKIPKNSSNRNTNKRLKHFKPYWCEGLQLLWNTMSDKEKAFLRYKESNRVKSRLRLEYISARNSFDKFKGVRHMSGLSLMAYI